MAPILICFLIFFLRPSSGQMIGSEPINITGICKSVFCNRIDKLRQLENCVVILGNLHVLLLEQAQKEDFQNKTFPKLREVNGFVVFYRVYGLESIGQLFPNLAIIRGNKVLNNYALIIYDMPDIKEINLYNLLRIDRGGVIIWAVPQACYINTINWKVIAPYPRHVLSSTEDNIHCSSDCTCTSNASTNRCWNVRKCQRFLDGPEKMKCNDQCVGCRNTNPNECSVCRNRTHKGRCVSECPPDTIELQDVKYCITESECKRLKGWMWNKTCVFECPIGYKKQHLTNAVKCVPCNKCEEVCSSLSIETLSKFQEASRCVKINGSLTIRIRSLPDTMMELKKNLQRLQEVSDYIVIYGSPTISSLDFLPSLRYIGGRKLKNGPYSLLVYEMASLQSLFTENVTRSLKVGSGTAFFHNNPMLCMSEVDRIVKAFPRAPSTLDIPPGTNGYSGGCMNASVVLHVTVINETSVSVNFTHITDPAAQYSILYIRLPPGSRKIFVPETCSDMEWHAYNIPNELKNNSVIKLTALQPASLYALCVEKYDPKKKILARSNIYNFSTPVGKPEPPFILELVASSSDVVVLRWVDHKIYRPHITRYELDVTLIEIYPRDVNARDHCKYFKEKYEDIDIFRHAVVMRPPAGYDRGCESMCGILSSVTAGAMVEEYFDICSSIASGCDEEASAPNNSSYGKFVRTLTLSINGARGDYQVGGLAPFRDYRFRLRACNGKCSRSATGVVRTLRSEYADMPTIVFASVDDHGFVSVKWEPPEVTNGPVLSYSLSVLPSLKNYELSQMLPQIWCVSSDKNVLIVKSVKSDMYLVTICATTLASRSACSEKTKVVTASAVNWWTGITLGVLLFFATTVVGITWKRQRIVNYELSLLENMVITEDSEPPSAMLSDFFWNQ